MTLCDLHNHSTASDGTLSPREVARLGAEKGLAAVALTDHNTVEGLLEFEDEAKKWGLFPVAGIEVSADFRGVELHILGLFLPREAWDTVGARMTDLAARKAASNEKLARGLREAGYSVTMEELGKKYGNNINRSHFQRFLREKGLVDPAEDLFETVLSEKRGLYVPPKREDALEIVAFLKSVGAVPVWAHPFLKKTEALVSDFLPLAKEVGLAGVEVLYSEYTLAHQARAAELCREFDLLPSGGSDFHGTAKAGIDMGKGRGNLEIPFAWCEALAARR